MIIQGVTVKGFAIRDLPEAVTSGLAYYLDAGDPASYPGSGTAITNISGTATEVLQNYQATSWRYA